MVTMKPSGKIGVFLALYPSGTGWIRLFAFHEDHDPGAEAPLGRWTCRVERRLNPSSRGWFYQQTIAVLVRPGAACLAPWASQTSQNSGGDCRATSG